MSVTILLIPVALAAASLAGGTGLTAAFRAKNDAGAGDGPATAVSVRTRMKDRGLLGLALEDLGAVDVSVGAAEVSAVVDDHRLTMTLTDDDVWEAHFERTDGLAVDEGIAGDILTRLDGAYAGRVQSAVAARIRAQADSAGFELVSETRDDDATVTMVLNVRQDA
ncbi:hypothetical protein CLV49_0111 [Labedella gwakjiensis]|uniref:Uncharacterized protein n=1 Tax=Labedella gwakjiensis TaxID=390269 RepID=A0A2P8GRB4_9MICO|nr:hypothetical protein [Labedella gwakjiensis]PSL36519.1 hypothetical protein CLV49_0111 [Labedella gwakjiensis]RUQ85563.1 hypothetical protein ELQ93_00510 [Labedella gwakjiensis]